MKVINSDALYQDLLADLEYPLLHAGSSPHTVAKYNLIQSFLKKFKDTADLQLCDAVAREKFHTINERCGVWQLEELSLGDQYLVGEFRKAVHEFFEYRDGTPLVHSHHDILSVARNGPGVSVGSDSTDFYTKLFDSKLSCTSNGLYRMYTDYIRAYPLWSEAEETRLRTREGPDVVNGSRLAFVPKTAATSRSICVEPTLNMFFQLGLGSIIESRLRQLYRIRLDEQPDINRRLAYLGSVQDGNPATHRLVTIDLSNASDSISMRMLREFLPTSFMNWLEILRSPYATDQGREVELNMVSTMGNGFTFPLETAVFCCVVHAAFRLDTVERLDNPADSRNLFNQHDPNWGVFGDDIIVPYRLHGKVLRLLNILGFEVNVDKSFFEGPFRESCGSDFYDGVGVRGVYCKTLRTPQDVYSIVNQLNAWSSYHGVPLVKTIRRLLSVVPRIAIPLWENAESGVWVPERLLPLLARNVWRSTTGSYLYKRYVPRRVSYTILESGILTPRGHKPRVFNGPGLWLSFLAGHLRDGKIHLKPRVVRYSLRRGVAPDWESHPTVRCPFKGSGGWRRGLNPAVLANLANAW